MTEQREQSMLKRLFQERVETERLVLMKLNDALGSPFLSGLSTNAIERWVNERGDVPSTVADLTRKIALRARLDADASRDVFDAEEAASAGSIDGLLVALDKELAAV